MLDYNKVSLRKGCRSPLFDQSLYVRGSIQGVIVRRSSLHAYGDYDFALPRKLEEHSDHCHLDPLVDFVSVLCLSGSRPEPLTS